MGLGDVMVGSLTRRNCLMSSYNGPPTTWMVVSALFPDDFSFTFLLLFLLLFLFLFVVAFLEVLNLGLDFGLDFGLDERGRIRSFTTQREYECVRSKSL